MPVLHTSLSVAGQVVGGRHAARTMEDAAERENLHRLSGRRQCVRSPPTIVGEQYPLASCRCLAIVGEPEEPLRRSGPRSFLVLGSYT